MNLPIVIEEIKGRIDTIENQISHEMTQITEHRQAIDEGYDRIDVMVERLKQWEYVLEELAG